MSWARFGRDQVARLMRAEGIEGAVLTTPGPDSQAGPPSARHPDLVERDFTATSPNQLGHDLTYVPMFAGIAYVCFIIDVFSRMIVGWRGNQVTRPAGGARSCAWHVRAQC